MKPVYSKAAAKAIGGMDNATKQRIKAAIEKLPEGDVKQIKGKGIVTYRLRVGGWRVLYSLDGDDVVFVEKIAPRGEIYKGV